MESRPYRHAHVISLAPFSDVIVCDDKNCETSTMLRQFSSKNISNHLQLLWLLRLYRNANDEWRKHYRAVAVAQITTTLHPANLDLLRVYGFICIDNRSGGFDNGVCRELLTHLVRHLYPVTVQLGQVRIAGTESAEKETRYDSLDQGGQEAKQGELH